MENKVKAPETASASVHGLGAVILAAGYSSRMKAFKPLLDVGGVSALERLVKALVNSDVGRVVIVTGYNREKLQPAIAELDSVYGAGNDTVSRRIIEAYNEDYHKGMFSSIKKGLSVGREAFDHVKGFFLIPVDSPLISSGVINTLVENMGEAVNGRFFTPVFEGKKGHPLFIPTGYVEEICAYEGAGGLKAITDRYRHRMIRVPVEEEGCVMDMDTPEGYDEIKAFLAAGRRRRDIRELAVGKRIFLVRHGETRRHAEKMFIGRYDVPLKEDAHIDVERMALRIAEENPQVNVIYTSPLKRAEQTARILRDVLRDSTHRVKAPDGHDLRLCMMENLREIHLGEWDGRPISWVKENYPEEYRLRGQDIFAFKTGNKAENFYDVQYRAVKALRGILEKDESGDVIIVTHSTVIRALENNLKGMRVDDKWDKLAKNAFKIINL